MTIVRYAGNTITCLSSDTKPTTMPDGARAFETNTARIYLKVSGTWTLIPSLQLIENTPIILVSSPLSSDGKYSGFTEAGIAGEALSFGHIIYQNVSTGKWNKANATGVATSKGKIGLCVLNASGDGQPTTVLLWGKVNAASVFPTFTVYAPVFIDTTAGLLTSTAPSGTEDFVVRCVGQANSGDELYFNPSVDYITILA